MHHSGERLTTWRDPWIVGACFAGVGVRLAMLVARRGDVLPFTDAFWYSAQSKALRKGLGFNGLLDGQPTAEHGPLTPILLWPASSGDVVDNQRALMTVYGILGLATLAVLAVRLLTPLGARIACVIAAIYPNLWMHDSIIMSESIAIGLVSVTMLALLTVRQRPTWWNAGALGLAGGLAGLARSELVLLIPLCAIIAWSFARRPEHVGDDRRLAPLAVGALVLAGGAVVLAPWVGHNLSRFEEPTLLTTNDGTTWLGANCDVTWETSLIGSWSLACVLGIEETVGKDPSERSSIQRQLASEYIGDNTGRLPLVLVARGARLLDVYGLADMNEGDVKEDKFGWAVWLGIGSWWVLAPLAVVGIARIARRDRLIVLPPIIAVIVTTFLFYGGHRIRAPMEPAVVLAAGAGVAALWARRRPISEPDGAGGSRSAST